MSANSGAPPEGAMSAPLGSHYARTWCQDCREALQAPVRAEERTAELQCPKCGKRWAMLSLGKAPLRGLMNTTAYAPSKAEREEGGK